MTKEILHVKNKENEKWSASFSSSLLHRIEYFLTIECNTFLGMSWKRSNIDQKASKKLKLKMSFP